ncbi:MAG: hypothetical protein H7X86_11760 [Gorillibacterium sp.]|nr:hypothetical protein [Gorillibacterium sp.]
MLKHIKQGLTAAWHQPFLLVTLFIYRFAWGFAIYRLIVSQVIPLLHRYPGEGGPVDQSQLFLIESEIRLTKTNVLEEYLWLLLILLVIRMLITPLLNAGVFYSLANTHLNSGYRFFKGMKSLGGAFYLFYAVRTLLTLLPLYFLAPQLKRLFGDLPTTIDHRNLLLLYVAIFLVYSYLLYLLFLHIQFGRTFGSGLLPTLLRSIKGMLPIIGVAVLLLALSGLASGIMLTTVLLDAGLWTFILYQAYGFVGTLFALWGITSQHEVFEEAVDGYKC